MSPGEACIDVKERGIESLTQIKNALKLENIRMMSSWCIDWMSWSEQEIGLVSLVNYAW